MTPRPYRYFIYEGFAAVPYGCVFVIAGATLATGGLAYFAGVDPTAMRTAILQRPHLALIPAGAALLCQGLGFVIGFRRRTESFRDRLAVGLMHLPAMLGGLILVVLGAAALAVGVYEWMDADAFDRAVASVANRP